MNIAPFDAALAACVTFGIRGNAVALRAEGWAAPEDGFTWSVGDGSRIRIPYRAAGAENVVLAVEISVAPMRAPGVPLQALSVLVDGVVCGTETLPVECILGFLAPGVARGVAPGVARGVAAGQLGEIEVCLRHPHAAVPADFGVGEDRRRLGVAVQDITLSWVKRDAPFTPRRRDALVMRPAPVQAESVRGCTGLPAAEMLRHFESIGNNCEFGLVQRAHRVEKLGLLRFGGIAPADLLRGLKCGFDGIDDPAQITLLGEDHGGRAEYTVGSERYAMRFHSFVGTDLPAADMRIRMAAHLGLLRRKFEETLRGGRTVFVLHHPSCASVAQVRPFLNVLRHWGAGALLFVTEDNDAVGSVDQLAADLFHGHIDRLMPQDYPDQINDAAWLSICANTYRMWRESGGGSGLDDA